MSAVASAFVQIICAFIVAIGSIIAAWRVGQRTIKIVEKIENEKGGSTMITRRWRFIIKFVLFLVPVFGFIIGWRVGQAVTGEVSEIKAPFEVSGYFYPSGWMGDGEKGEAYIQLNDQWKENSHSAPTCIRITYHPNKKGWAGIYWQYPDGNWGDSPGRRINGAKRLTFWARGEKGGELVTFKAGGINAAGKKYRDSFEMVIGPVELKKEWQKHEIDLAGADLSSVLGAFAWSANRSGNPDGLTFYIDDIRYE